MKKLFFVFILIFFCFQLNLFSSSNIYQKMFDKSLFNNETCELSDGSSCAKNYTCGDFSSFDYNCDQAEQRFDHWFSGDYIIVKEDHIKNNESDENYFILKVFDAFTGKLINTISWKKVREGSFSDESEKNFDEVY